jgi:hypothetical protein
MCLCGFNPNYALGNLLRAEISSKHNASPLFRLHHSGYYASVEKVSVLLSFQPSLRFLMHNLVLKTTTQPWQPAVSQFLISFL